MKNGTCWLDAQGSLIQAHGGMIARFGDRWYWYGENKDADNSGIAGGLNRVDAVGFSCYSSTDLHCWHHEGIVLHSSDDPSHPLWKGGVMERPKVIYSTKTGKYVMWFHLDSADYELAHAACAVADRPEGPFRYLHHLAPNRRDSRDMTLYEDPRSGKAYLVHSGDWNKTLYFSELTEDRTGLTGVCHAQMADQEREAPALCWHDGLYYCLTSGCTGWAPNSALYATTPQLTNGMKLIDNPCEGEGYRTTFGAQGSYLFEAGGQWYWLIDHWKPKDLRHSGYSILPVSFEEGRMTIRWQDEF